jgi:hypothetical protein
VEPPQQLPDLPQNAALLRFLRGQASPPNGPNDHTLGSWQLHTHPDLMTRLRELAPGWPLAAAYGVPLLASRGIAAVVALGTDWLALRIQSLPPGIVASSAAPAWSSAGDEWHVASPWQSQLPAPQGTRRLRELVTAALDHAASLAPDSGW